MPSPCRSIAKAPRRACRGPAALSLVLLLALAAPAAAQVPPSVLILTSETTQAPGVGLVIDRAVDAMRQARGAVNAYIESFELSSFPGDSESLATLCRQRYGGRRLDLVITLCPQALDFALRHRNEIFPGAPILYSFVDASMVAALPAAANVSGVLLQPKWLDVIDRALKLHPKTREMLVVSGASEFDRGWRASFDAAAAAFDSKVRRRYATARSMSELLGEVATAPDDSLVFFLTFSRDGAGTTYVPRDVVDMVRRVARAPVYGPSVTYIGHGVVGGSLTDLQAHGDDLGRMAVRVLAGERPDHIKPVTTPNVLAFDWRELQRFGISERQLPPGAQVLFRERGFWTFRPSVIIGAVVLFGGQTALIVAMLAQRRKRASLERRLKARLRFETLLSDVSAALGGVTIPQIETAAHTAVASMRQYLGVDRVSIFEFTPDNRARRTVEDAGPDALPAPNDYLLAQLPMISLSMVSLQPFVMERAEDLPEDAAYERAAVRENRIRSMLIVPLEVGGRSLGALSCASHTREMKWPADRVQQVRTLAQTLANAILRRRDDFAVAESDRLRGAILSSMSAQIAVLNRAGVIIAANDAWLAFGRENGVRHEASISPGASYLAVCERAAEEGVEGAAGVLDGIKAVCEGRADAYDAEYQLAGTRGERWFAMKVVPLRHAERGAVVTHRDITVEKEQEIALRHSEQRARLLAETQRILSGRLITAQEDERRRIARELHDDLQQRLALLAIDLDSVAAKREALTSDEAVVCARGLWQKTVDISSDVHALSHRLHPSKLEALGLLKTVQGHCRELSQHGLSVAFAHDGVPDSIPQDVALCAFRVVQESLQNVVKHSGAESARVTMKGCGGSLRVAIEDDGRGFDAAASTHRAGLGLVSMRERLRLVGGELSIESVPGRGTVVSFDVPCANEEGVSPSGAAASEEARTR